MLYSRFLDVLWILGLPKLLYNCWIISLLANILVELTGYCDYNEDFLSLSLSIMILLPAALPLFKSIFRSLGKIIKFGGFYYGELLTTIESLRDGLILFVSCSDAFNVRMVKVLLMLESTVGTLSLPVMPVLLVLGDIILY